MGIVNAYFDESGKYREHPVVTFCGVCVSQEKLKRFDDCWNALLQHYGWRSLHMVKAMKSKKFSEEACKKRDKERKELRSKLRRLASQPFDDLPVL